MVFFMVDHVILLEIWNDHNQKQKEKQILFCEWSNATGKKKYNINSCKIKSFIGYLCEYKLM